MQHWESALSSIPRHDLQTAQLHKLSSLLQADVDYLRDNMATGPNAMPLAEEDVEYVEQQLLTAVTDAPPYWWGLISGELYFRQQSRGHLFRLGLCSRVSRSDSGASDV